MMMLETLLCSSDVAGLGHCTLNHRIGNCHSYCEDSLNDFVDSLIDSDNFDDLVNSGSGPVASGPVY